MFFSRIAGSVSRYARSRLQSNRCSGFRHWRRIPAVTESCLEAKPCVNGGLGFATAACLRSNGGIGIGAPNNYSVLTIRRMFSSQFPEKRNHMPWLDNININESHLAMPVLGLGCMAFLAEIIYDRPKLTTINNEPPKLATINDEQPNLATINDEQPNLATINDDLPKRDIMAGRQGNDVIRVFEEEQVNVNALAPDPLAAIANHRTRGIERSIELDRQVRIHGKIPIKVHPEHNKPNHFILDLNDNLLNEFIVETMKRTFRELIHELSAHYNSFDPEVCSSSSGGLCQNEREMLRQLMEEREKSNEKIANLEALIQSVMCQQAGSQGELSRRVKKKTLSHSPSSSRSSPILHRSLILQPSSPSSLPIRSLILQPFCFHGRRGRTIAVDRCH